MKSIPVYTPTLEPYKTSTKHALDTGWVSCHGIYKDKATKKLQDYLGVNRVLLTCNGTTATHCLFIALKYRYPNIRKIYVPNHVYVAAIHSALFEYPLEVLELLEIDQDTWNMRTDEEYLLGLEQDSALMVVHNIGNIVNVPRIKRLRPDLVIVEDNCEGLFGTYEGIYSGCYPGILCSSISFFANKTITSGEGGAVIVPEDEELADMLSRKISQGMTSEKYLHDMVAYNYRMTNIEAALLYDQLCDIDNIRESKLRVFQTYRKHLLDNINNGRVSFQVLSPETTHSTWMVALRVSGNPDYSMVSKFLKERGIDTRPFFYRLNRHKHLRNIPFLCNDNAISQILENEIVILPSYPSLTEEDIIYICRALTDYLGFLDKGKHIRIEPLKELYKLSKFCEERISNGGHYFRYFDTRPVSVCENHILTLVAMLDDEIIGYGHLDPEYEKVWLGICISDMHVGKGLGKRIMKKLIDYADINLMKLHLTVDKDNLTAIYLYRIYGFEIETDLGDKYFMNRDVLKPLVKEAEITVPVSIGEAMDKYTILQIKEAKINDKEKLEAVKKEKKALSLSLGGYLEEYSHYINILRNINQQIWEDQDKFRECDNSVEQGEICTKIIKDNDGRFRVKKKINTLVKSKFKEQKSYATKKCLLLGHLGMGDMITMIGATRYLSIYYDEVLVVVKARYADSVKLIYADDPDIKFLLVENDGDISPVYGCNPEVLNSYKERGYEIFKCGFHAQSLGSGSLDYFYKQFYKDLGLEWSIRTEYGHVSRNIAEEKRIYRKVTKYHSKYIFVHDYDSQDISSKLLGGEELVFNVNRNAYPIYHLNHYVWDKTFSKESITHFGYLIENAEELHLADSAFFCYCAYLDLSKVKRCVVYTRYSYYKIEDYINPNQKWEIRSG